MELAKNFKNSIPGGVADPIPDGDDITGNDNNIDSNHFSPTPSIADQIETFVTSPSPKLVITHDSPRVSNQSTNKHSLPGWYLLQHTRRELLIQTFADENQRKNHLLVTHSFFK